MANPANLVLTAGQIHDLAGAKDLIENADPQALIADKAYDADPLIDSLTERELTPNRDCDLALYCKRNLIERSANKIKHFRGHRDPLRQTRTNFSRFLAAVQLVSAITLRNSGQAAER